MPLPVAAGTAYAAFKGLRGALGRLKSPAQLEAARGASVVAAQGHVRAGITEPQSYNMGDAVDVHPPLAALVHWANHAARSGTRAAAAAALAQLESEGLIAKKAPGRGSPGGVYEGVTFQYNINYGYPRGGPKATTTVRASPEDDLEEFVKAAGGSAKPKARGGARATRRTRAPRTYVRYDPDTGERVLVTADDPRFDEWTNRKPRASRAPSAPRARRAATAAKSRRKTTAQKARDRYVDRISRDVANAGLQLTAAGIQKFAAMAANAGMSVGVAAALVVSVGLVSYHATRWLLDRIATVRDPAYKKEQIALAYRRARLDWARAAGRELNHEEHAFLAEMFKRQLSQAGV